MSAVTCNEKFSFAKSHFDDCIKRIQEDQAAATRSGLINVSINTHCPWSRKEVALDSLTSYKSFTVGFCNPNCRDTFASSLIQCRDDTSAFSSTSLEFPRFDQNKYD